MIKILRSPLKEHKRIEDDKEIIVKEEPLIVYTVSADKDGIGFSFVTKRYELEIAEDIRFDYAKYAGQVIQIAVITTDVVNDLKVYPIFDTVDKFSFLQNRVIAAPDMNIARIVFNEDCSDVVIMLSKDADEIAGFTNFTFDRKENSATGFLAKHSSFLAEKIKKRKIKATMLNQIDIYASIAYLEAQVDTLTRAIQSIITEENDWKAILDRADQDSVLNIKSKEAILNEFAYKHKVRELQEAYYDAK